MQRLGETGSSLAVIWHWAISVNTVHHPEKLKKKKEKNRLFHHSLDCRRK